MLGRGRRRGCHGVWPVRRDLGIHEHFTPLGGSEVERVKLSHWMQEHRGPGGDTASALGLIIGPGRLGSLKSEHLGPQETGYSSAGTDEDPEALLPFPARLTHTLSANT